MFNSKYFNYLHQPSKHPVYKCCATSSIKYLNFIKIVFWVFKNVNTDNMCITYVCIVYSMYVFTILFYKIKIHL